jgi:SAM-dependent methyltransferase
LTYFYQYKWPKVLKPLTDEQKAIGDDFMKFFTEQIPNRYGLLDRYGHNFIAQSMRKISGMRTLEIGSGVGEHIEYEDLGIQEYWANEYRPKMADAIKRRFPTVNVINSDCQGEFEFADGFFDRVIAIHMLEHLPDLPRAVGNIHRLLKDDGQLGIVIPCDPGFAYSLGRKFTSARAFKKRYNQDIGWFVESEHINAPEEIMHVLKQDFKIVHQRSFPLLVPIKHINLVYHAVLEKKG